MGGIREIATWKRQGGAVEAAGPATATVGVMAWGHGGPAAENKGT